MSETGRPDEHMFVTKFTTLFKDAEPKEVKTIWNVLDALLQFGEKNGVRCTKLDVKVGVQKDNAITLYQHNREEGTFKVRCTTTQGREAVLHFKVIGVMQPSLQSEWNDFFPTARRILVPHVPATVNGKRTSSNIKRDERLSKLTEYLPQFKKIQGDEALMLVLWVLNHSAAPIVVHVIIRLLEGWKIESLNSKKKILEALQTAQDKVLVSRIYIGSDSESIYMVAKGRRLAKEIAERK